jgi:hypothetical protein
MAARKQDELGDLTWLFDADPSAENLARAVKLRTALMNRVGVVDGIIATWKQAPGAAYAEPAFEAARADKNGHSVQSLIDHYKTNPASPYYDKRYASRLHTDSLCRFILDDMGPVKIADISADDMHATHAKWVARAAANAKGKGDGTAMGHALITQLRTVVNYGAKELQDRDCLRLSFVLRNLRIKVLEPRKSEPLRLDQIKSIMRAAHDLGWHSIALAQAFQFECKLRQRDVIGEWVPLGEKGAPSDLINDGSKWLRGLRWNEIDGDDVLRHSTSKTQKPVRIELKSKPLVMEELKRFYPRPATGPIIIDDRTGLPWNAWKFRRAWREIARKAGLPDDVMNMDSRAQKTPRHTEGDAASQEVAG